VLDAVDGFSDEPFLAVDGVGNPHISYSHSEYRVYLPLVLKGY
jgi:hypothetical protein